MKITIIIHFTYMKPNNTYIYVCVSIYTYIYNIIYFFMYNSEINDANEINKF